jgi:hypothetical protein
MRGRHTGLDVQHLPAGTLHPTTARHGCTKCCHCGGKEPRSCPHADVKQLYRCCWTHFAAAVFQLTCISVASLPSAMWTCTAKQRTAMARGFNSLHSSLQDFAAGALSLQRPGASCCCCCFMAEARLGLLEGSRSPGRASSLTGVPLTPGPTSRMAEVWQHWQT